MRNGTEATEAHRQYAAAHAMHYGNKDLGEALDLYQGILATHPDSLEAGYSRAQVQNIVRAVVPEQDLFDAQVELARANV